MEEVRVWLNIAAPSADGEWDSFEISYLCKDKLRVTYNEQLLAPHPPQGK